MLRIGAHMPVAGGVSQAVDRAVVHGCEALQVFSKNASQWRGKPLDTADVRRFRTRIDQTGITPVVSHASYLINLATTFPVLREQSIAAFVDELDRAHALELIADAIRQALAARPRRKTMVILEHTAGQGRTLGHRFEHLAAVIGHLNGSTRIGVCLDTCHLVASGYDIVSDTGYRETFDAFDRLAGIDRLKVFHGNDSKKPCGSRVDRHEHIGQSCLGEAPFHRLLHDTRFAGLPILIETEKSKGSERAGMIVADPLDMQNLETLRRLRAVS